MREVSIIPNHKPMTPKTSIENESQPSCLGAVMPRIISMWEHSGWGDSIYFTDWDKRRVAGHLTPTPKEGDIIRCKMESGKIARFKFDKVDVMSDTKDQFFATVSDLGYEA